MTNTRRKFTPEERLALLQEGEREGRTETLRKYNLAPSLFDRWKKKYLIGGIAGLKRQHKKGIPAEVRLLQEENERLKRIVAKQALELEVKTELLKKTPIGTKIK